MVHVLGVHTKRKLPPPTCFLGIFVCQSGCHLGEDITNDDHP